MLSECCSICVSLNSFVILLVSFPLYESVPFCFSVLWVDVYILFYGAEFFYFVYIIIIIVMYA
jgi:hypothetical protein